MTNNERIALIDRNNPYANQNQNRSAGFTGWQSEGHRKSALKWAYKNYGGKYDIGYYLTGERTPGLIQLDQVKDGSQIYWNIMDQYNYAGGKYHYANEHVNPYKSDKTEIDAMNSYLKENGYNAFDQKKYQQVYNKLKYKDEYDKSIVQDVDAYNNGLKPYKYQMSDKAVDEYDQLMRDLQSGAVNGQNWRERYPTLAAYTDYAVGEDKIKKDAEAKAVEKWAEDHPDEPYAPPADNSSILGTKKTKGSPIDLDTLKQIGYDEATGFNWIADEIVRRQQAVNNANYVNNPTPDTRVLPTPARPEGLAIGAATGALGAMPRPRPLPVMPNATLPAGAPLSAQGRQNLANAGQTLNATQPTPQQNRTIDAWGTQAPAWMPDWMIGLARTGQRMSGVISAPFSVPVNLVKEGISGIQALAYGQPYKWGIRFDPDQIVASDKSYADLAKNNIRESVNRGLDPFMIFGANKDDALGTSFVKFLDENPVANTAFNIIGEAAIDPSTYISGESLLKIAKLAKIGKTAEATKEIEAIAAKVGKAKAVSPAESGLRRGGIAIPRAVEPVATAEKPAQWLMRSDPTTKGLFSESADGQFIIRPSNGKFNLYENTVEGGMQLPKFRGGYNTLDEAKAATAVSHAPQSTGARPTFQSMNPSTPVSVDLPTGGAGTTRNEVLKPVVEPVVAKPVNPTPITAHTASTRSSVLDAVNRANAKSTVRSQWESQMPKGDYVYISVGDGTPYVLTYGDGSSLYYAINRAGNTADIVPSFTQVSGIRSETAKLFNIEGEGSGFTVIKPARAQLNGNNFVVTKEGRGLIRRGDPELLTPNSATTRAPDATSASPAEMRPTSPQPIGRATVNPRPSIGNVSSERPQAIVGAAKEPSVGYRVAEGQTTASATMSGRPVKPMPIGEVGQRSYEAQKVAPEGMSERGLSENIRTDANSPDALRDSYSQDPEFYKVVSNSDTLAKAQAVYDQGAQAARTQLTTLIDQMKPEAVPLAKMLARDAVQANKLDEAREILSSVASKLTESGQFGQAARILRQSDPETVIMTLDKQLRKLNTDGAKVYGKKWKDFDMLPSEADELAKIKPGDEAAIEAFMQKFHNRIADQMPSTALEKLTAWRHMAMLLNPKTHLRNMIGNGLMFGLNRASSRLSGVLQKVLPRQLRTSAAWVKREFKRLADDFFIAHENDIYTGGNKYNEGIGLNMPDKRVFKVQPIEAVRKFNYKALDAEDKFFFKRAYTDRLASAMQARGIKSIDDVPQDLLTLAKNEAEKAVFRDKFKISSDISRWKQMKGGFVLDTFLPFTKTPINIARRGFDYSPGGVLKGLGKLFKPDTAAEGIEDLAKGLTGTGVMVLGYYLADNGILTGAAPKDKDLANYDKATGNAPFSILGAITYDWAQPFAIPLTVGVAIHDALTQDPQSAAKLRRAMENGDTETMVKIAGGYGQALLDSFEAAGDTMFNMSVMQGVQSLFNNPDGIAAALLQIPANYVNQMIPTALGQVARSIDPVIRQTNFGAADPRTMIAPIINKIPGASMLLPPKITPFGKEQRGIENPILRTVQNFLNPGNLTAKQDIDPQVDAELRRLYDVGQLKQFPTTVDRSFKFMDKMVSLNDAEYADYQRTTGQETITAFKDIINSDEYRKIPPKELTTRLKSLAATRGTTVPLLRNDPKVMTRIQEEYRAYLLSKGILYAKAMGQLQILRKRGLIGNLSDKQLADRMGISKEIAGQIN